MELNEINQLMSVFGAISVVVIPAAWHLSTRIQRIQGSQESHGRTVEAKLDNIEIDLRHVREEIKAAREGRANIWEKLNDNKTRITRAETVLDMKKGESA